MSAHVAISRTVGRALTGRRVMLCAHAHWRGWRRFEWIADWAFFCLRGEIGHCGLRGEEEAAGWGVREPDEVARLRRRAGL